MGEGKGRDVDCDAVFLGLSGQVPLLPVKGVGPESPRSRQN